MISSIKLISIISLFVSTIVFLISKNWLITAVVNLLLTRILRVFSIGEREETEKFNSAEEIYVSLFILNCCIAIMITIGMFSYESDIGLLTAAVLLINIIQMIIYLFCPCRFDSEADTRKLPLLLGVIGFIVLKIFLIDTYPLLAVVLNCYNEVVMYLWNIVGSILLIMLMMYIFRLIRYKADSFLIYGMIIPHIILHQYSYISCLMMVVLL